MPARCLVPQANGQDRPGPWSGSLPERPTGGSGAARCPSRRAAPEDWAESFAAPPIHPLLAATEGGPTVLAAICIGDLRLAGLTRSGDLSRDRSAGVELADALLHRLLIG